MKSIILAGNKRSADVNSEFIAQLETQISKLSKFSEVMILSNVLVQADLKKVTGDFKIIRTPDGTAGALATVGFGLSSLSDNEPFLILPSNSEVADNLTEEFLKSMLEKNAVVGAIVFRGSDPLYSYARLGKSGEVIEVVEKKVSGSCAMAGIYFFSSRDALSDCLEWAMVNNIQNSGNFFISPALNYFLAKFIEISLFEIENHEYSRH